MLIELVGSVKVQAFKCERCNYVWCPREKNDKPKTCAKCRSPYWDTPRRG